MGVEWDREQVRVRHVEARKEHVDIDRLRERNCACGMIVANFKT